MKEITKEEIDKILADYEKQSSENVLDTIIKNDIENKISAHFEKKSILGFDIYRYSQYPLIKQTLIPFLFKELYKLTIANCLKHEPFIFQNKKESDFANFFIDAGDGGFQIFDTPFHAIVFAIYFQANIKRFNSGRVFQKTLRKITGEITLRYCLTFDNTYSYSKNFYGPSIINNARIMSKDKLNRFLVDNNAITWFTENLNGLENLQVITLKEDFNNIDLFKEYKIIDGIKDPSVLFDLERAKILKVDLLRIGEINSKLHTLEVYSLHIQILMHSTTSDSFRKYTISLGNLNSLGIAD